MKNAAGVNTGLAVRFIDMSLDYQVKSGSAYAGKSWIGCLVFPCKCCRLLLPCKFVSKFVDFVQASVAWYHINNIYTKLP